MEPQNIIYTRDKQNTQFDEIVENNSSQNKKNEVNINNVNVNRDSIETFDKNNINEINNNLNNVNDNNVHENNIISNKMNPANDNNTNDLNKNNQPNILAINDTNNSIGHPPQNDNSPVQIQALDINNFNHQENPVNIYPQENYQDLSCKEKYPNCFWKTKLLCFYDYCDDSEENKIKLENATVCECFFLLSIFYYILFIISEILIFIYILFKYVFKCLGFCCIKIDEAAKDIQKSVIEADQKKRKLDDINRRIENLDKEHKNMDREVVFGNPLNDPGYQMRVIESNERKYAESRAELERQRNNI